MATGATEWVFVNAVTHRPRTIPASVSGCLELVTGADDEKSPRGQ
jgi:acyl-CoA thioester hydrolase